MRSNKKTTSETIQREINDILVTAEKHDTGLTPDKLILFIAYVINCADQAKHKTEKIKIL